MKTFKPATLLTLCLGLMTLAASAQDYSITWYSIAGGGGTSSAGQYSVTSTIAQPDAGAAMAGGGYSLTGGFWSLIAAQPTIGLPSLTISYLKPNTVVVSWPDLGSYHLLESAEAAHGSWGTSTNTVTSANGTNSISLTLPRGYRFFRLVQTN